MCKRGVGYVVDELCSFVYGILSFFLFTFVFSGLTIMAMNETLEVTQFD